MIPRKLAEIGFRRIWLLLLPIVAIPAAIVLLAGNTRTYESSAIVWVASPLPGAPTLGHQNPYLSPAQNEAITLNDLLSTKSFRDTVAAKAGDATSHPDLVSHRDSYTVFSFSNGVNLLTVRARAETAEDAQALVVAAVSEFRDRALAQVERTSGLSEEYYTQQLQVAQLELDRRRKAVDDYIGANPAIARGDPSATLDINYRTLIARVDEQSSVVADLQKALQQAQLDLVSAPEGQEATFQVQDEAELPEAALPRPTTKAVGYPLAGMALGVMLAAAYLYVAYRTDHTIQSSEEVAALGVPVLGKVPELRSASRSARLVHPWRRMRPDFARQTAATISSERMTGANA